MSGVSLLIGENEVMSLKDVNARPDGRAVHNGAFIRIRPGEKHTTRMGKRGGAWMTFEKWLDGKPMSIDQDWNGDPIA